MRKFIAGPLFLLILVCTSVSFSDSLQNGNVCNTLTLGSGKPLILPPFPGLVRVDGLYPDIDHHFLPANLKQHFAIFSPSEEIWTEHHKIRLSGKEPKMKAGGLTVEAFNYRYTGDQVQKAVEIFSRFASRDGTPFGNIPDSGFWCYGASQSATQGLIIYAYTILDGQIIQIAFSAAQEFSKITPEWIKIQEQMVLNWVVRLREVNHELAMR